jgi:hypothetical protein
LSYSTRDAAGIVFRFAIGKTVGHEKVDYFLLTRGSDTVLEKIFLGKCRRGEQ